MTDSRRSAAWSSWPSASKAIVPECVTFHLALRLANHVIELLQQGRDGQHIEITQTSQASQNRTSLAGLTVVVISTIVCSNQQLTHKHLACLLFTLSAIPVDTEQNRSQTVVGCYASRNSTNASCWTYLEEHLQKERLLRGSHKNICWLESCIRN